jgi:hypothetical protein
VFDEFCSLCTAGETHSHFFAQSKHGIIPAGIYNLERQASQIRMLSFQQAGNERCGDWELSSGRSLKGRRGSFLWMLGMHPGLKCLEKCGVLSGS